MIAIIGVAMDHAFEFVPGALLKGTPAVFLDPRMPVFQACRSICVLSDDAPLLLSCRCRV